MLPLHGQSTTTLEYCNGKQLRLTVRQPAKPLTSQLLLCHCLWVEGTDNQNSCAFEREREREAALSGRVWKHREMRQRYRRPVFRGARGVYPLAVSLRGVSSWRHSEQTADGHGVFSRQYVSG